MNRKRLCIMIVVFVAIVLAVIGAVELARPRNVGRDKEGVTVSPKLSMQEQRVHARQSAEYDVGRVIRNSNEPYDLHVIISIDSRHFTRDEMKKLARQLNQDFSNHQILVVDILDDEYIARRYMPVANEYTLFNEARRAVYCINRATGEEYIEFSTERGKPLAEVRIDFSESPKPK